MKDSDECWQEKGQDDCAICLKISPLPPAQGCRIRSYHMAQTNGMGRMEILTLLWRIVHHKEWMGASRLGKDGKGLTAGWFDV